MFVTNLPKNENVKKQVRTYYIWENIYICKNSNKMKKTCNKTTFIMINILFNKLKIRSFTCLFYYF